MLISRMNISPIVLITGIFNMLTDHYDRLADPANVSWWIDRCLENRQALEAQLMKPMEERAPGMTDEKIRALMVATETIMTNSSSGRQDAERLAIRVRQEWDKGFPKGYWYGWLMQHLSETMPPELRKNP